MNKNILILVSLFLVMSCSKKENDFERFEISYNSGWAECFSLVIWKDGSLEVKLLNESGANEIRGKKLLGKEFEIIKDQIKRIKIEDINYECIDCGVAAIEIKRNNKIYKMLQKGKLSNETNNLINTLIKIIHNPKLYYLLPQYKYKTEDRIIERVNFGKIKSNKQ